MSKPLGPYHRRGQPGGPCCAVGVLPITINNKLGEPLPAELLDAGPEPSELELLRTVASRLGVQWGHDDHGWWAVVGGRDFPSWTVWRQDDSGSEFVVGSNLTEDQARAMVAEFELKGHKQAYWCSRETIG